MKLQFYQIIVPMVGIVGLIISLREYRKGVYTFFESMLFNSFWVFISAVAIFPDATTIFISEVIGIKDHINGIIFVGLAILFFFNFRLFNLLKRQNKVITELVRKIAIDGSGTKDSPE